MYAADIYAFMYRCIHLYDAFTFIQYIYPSVCSRYVVAFMIVCYAQVSVSVSVSVYVSLAVSVSVSVSVYVSVSVARTHKYIYHNV